MAKVFSDIRVSGEEPPVDGDLPGGLQELRLLPRPGLEVLPPRPHPAPPQHLPEGPRTRADSTLRPKLND
jgi:hypothetical protein